MSKIRKLPQHNSQNYLKVILESIQLYNSHARADISNWLYEGYKKAETMENKKISQNTIVLELLSKRIEVFEDIALLGIMFAGYVIGETREPYEIYTSYHTQQIVNFLNKAKKGLSKEAMLKIYALPSVEKFVKEKVINKEELPYFKDMIDEAIESGKRTFANMASEFVGRKRRNKNTIDYGKMVQLYFNTKHGFKVIQPTETAKSLWNVEDIVIATRVDTTKWGRKVLRVRSFEGFTADDVKLIVERTNHWSEVTREIASAHLRAFDNPHYLVPLIRAKKTSEIIKNGTARPQRNDICLCGSQRKFKRCCESNL